MREAQGALELSGRRDATAAAVSLALLHLHEVGPPPLVVNNEKNTIHHKSDMYKSQIRQWFQIPNFFIY